MRYLPGLAKQWLLFFILLAAFVGSVLDTGFGTQLDYWIHDPAVVFQARKTWRYTGIVVLDDKIPTHVSRQQALPLFARAAEKLIAAGTKGLFLDANLSKEIEGIMPYAECIEPTGVVRWSPPTCLAEHHNQCQLRNSVLGNAPLKMADEVFPFFRVAPYFPGQADLPDFLLYDADRPGLEVLDRLLKKDSAIARWMDLSAEHAVIALANFIDAERVADTLAHETPEFCDQNLPCRRIRFGYPVYATQFPAPKPIAPVSQLASCDNQVAAQAAAYFKDRVVILQLTTPTEATDVIITPVTTALGSPHLLTPGPQYLADAVETLLNNDHPRSPHPLIKLLVYMVAASIGVLASLSLKQQSWLWVIGGLLLLALSGLCFWSPMTQLWPVTTTLITFIAGALEGIAIHLYIGFKEGNLIMQYMPKQVHNLLFSLKTNETFHNQRYQAIVLMSDLTGYTTVTGILKEPTHILELMNDYLNETSFVLQEQYEGWLETYIGDMVCYYWPYKQHNKTRNFENAIKGALALSMLQKRFFSDLLVRYQGKFDVHILQDISHVINAGIGLSAGSVVMGDLGPKRGVRKFGILGDPMNLTARVESLTRFFNTEIIITEDFLEMTIALGYPTRRLGCFCVKGREQPALLYALGMPEDPRFQRETIEGWESWLSAEERGLLHAVPCPALFALDQVSLGKWKARGLLRSGTWVLDEK